MKRLILIPLLIFTKLISAQISTEEGNDSLVKEPFVSRFFHDDPRIKHHHIFDFETGIPYSSFGYNYFYRLNPSFQIGGRMGMNFFKEVLYPYEDDLIMPYKIEGLLTYKVYRSISAEVGLGYYTNFNLSSKMNTIDHIAGRAGIDVSIFRYLFLRSGWSLSTTNSNFYSRISFSLGLKL